LLKGLDQIEGILRYRISSIEPNLLTDEIIDFVAHSRTFLPHFHIPLQAGSDHVLQLMHRRYDTALYAAKLEKIKSVMPDACIAADVMAGFNGETEEEFQKVLTFIDSLPISYLHVFTYSDRPGTAALKLGEKIPIPVRHEHTARLLELSEKKHKTFIDSQLGKTRPVLWESTAHGDNMQGWSDNYIRVARPYDPLMVNTIEEVTLSEGNIVLTTDH
jgi:threonylcarbamoyladenosine tRNA methylthiotransferase MtaB